MTASLLFAVLTSQPLGSVPRSTLRHMSEGVNITRWLCYTDTGAGLEGHVKKYWNAQDTKKLKSLGVDFVRLCVSPDVIYQDGKVSASRFPLLKQAVTRLTKDGFLVILDLHDNGQLKLDEPNKDNSGFLTFWKDLATRLKGYQESLVVFELVNEPVFQKNPQNWFTLQEKTVDAIRQIDPRRTLMVSSTSWSNIGALSAMPVLKARNLIYTVHSYDPFTFTHQGATWVGPQQQRLKHVPFPSSPEAVASAIAENDPQDTSLLKDYGDQRYGAEYLDKQLALAKAYGKANGVPIVLGEFGVYPATVLPEHRANWFAAMRAAVKKNGLPAAIWGYDDALGLGRKEDDHKWLDPITLRSYYGRG